MTTEPTGPDMVDDGFGRLQAFLMGGSSGGDRPAEPPYWRLMGALTSDGHPASAADFLSLLRHALRHRTGQIVSDARLTVPARLLPDDPNLPGRFGLEAIRVGDSSLVHAHAWRPDWLPDVPPTGVDGPAAAAVRRSLRQAVPADPFIRELGHQTYRSIGQAAAVRAVIDAPAGSTLAVVLPTGDGKSTAFHAIAKQGYADSPAGIGTTLVVTPTVSLALDHERSSAEYGYRQGPLAYRSGDAANNRVLAERIRDGSQTIVFAAPEAVATGLMAPLSDSAQAGLLRAVVIDEAHLVDSWGDVFRPEFQLLSGVRRRLMELQTGPALRTVLLTATLTDSSVAVLRGLFSDDPDGRLRVAASPSIRPEFDYWTPGFVESGAQEADVLDSVLHLPRPLILYTTTREQAAAWHSRLVAEGFSRIGLMTGETTAADREELVDRWRLNQTDLVVATSAFGLGIDNQQVRAVVHACAPESLDRYYQEVGRSGRDGNAAVSVLVPTHEDLRIGRDLAKRRLISLARGLQRWHAMFGTARTEPGGEAITVRVDVPPGVSERDIDMHSEQSRDWNLRTLTMMAMGGLLSLAGAPETRIEPGGERHEVVRVAALVQGHLGAQTWSEKVDPYRHRMTVASIASFGLLLDVVRGRRCVGDALAEQYRLTGDQLWRPESVAPEATCRGCRQCRAAGRGPRTTSVLTLAAHPWDPPAARLPIGVRLDPCSRLVVVYDRPLFPPSSVARRRRALLGLLAKSGFRCIRCDPELSAGLDGIQDEAGAQPVFIADHPLLGQAMPPGPGVILLDRPPPSGLLRCRQAEDAVIVFVPRDFELHRALERANCLVVSLGDLEERTVLS